MISSTGETPATVYYARWVYTGDTLLFNGAVRVTGSRIDAVGSRTGIRKSGDIIINLGSTLLMPGMINSCVRYEDAPIRHMFSQESTTLSRLRRHSAQQLESVSRHRRKQASALAVQEALSNGITASVNIHSALSTDDFTHMPQRFFHIGDISRERILSRSMMQGVVSRRARCESGITLPHIYSYPLAWVKAAARTCRSSSTLFALAIAETEEEFAAFTEGAGPLIEELRAAGKDYITDIGESPLRYAVRNSLIPRRSLICTPHFLRGDELGALEALHATVALAPRLSRRFDLPPFPIESALNRSMRIAVGTESCAHSPTINLLDELFEIHKNHPALEPQHLLNMVTQNPARALGMESALGKLAPGYLADMTGIRIDSLSKNPLSDIICGNNFVEFVIIDGDPIIVP
ncbi:MAG: amidohydrolase family protein [Fibrobacterota bacterium]